MDYTLASPLDEGTSPSPPTETETPEARSEPINDEIFESVQEPNSQEQEEKLEVTTEDIIVPNQVDQVTAPALPDTYATPEEPREHFDEEVEETTAVNYSINFSKLSQDFQPVPLGQVSFNTYTRGCKWSPDGLCILSLCDDNKLTIYDTPPDQVPSDYVMQPAVTMKEAETVYDFQWFPLMDSNKPETCCLATTSQYQPIHLYDAFDGHLRATYR